MRSSAPTLGIAIALLLAGVSPALAQSPQPAAQAPSLQAQVEAILATAPAGTRWGLLVVDAEGREVVAIDPDHRFIPASNTKLFTTAAAYATWDLRQPDRAGGAAIALVPVVAAARWRGGMLPGLSQDDPVPRGSIDVWLMGRGDARMSGAADCRVNCLAVLADAVAAKTQRVRNVIGSDLHWPDQRWSPGMSWNNIGTDSGTAVSALNLDDNEIEIVVRPSSQGQPPVVEGAGYFSLNNGARTGPPGSEVSLALVHPANGTELRLIGAIPADGPVWRERVGIDDPAHFAAWTLHRMLEARGVRVTGHVLAQHYPVGPDDTVHDPGPLGTRLVLQYNPLAELVPPPLAEDVVTINKVSQNLHAQALFRRLGDVTGTGSDAWSVAALHSILERAGIPRAGFDFSDGSGMSTYNRVSPRASVALLRWTQTQPWGAEWRASLPIGGVDGTLRRRFAGTPLQGRIWAKTGTLNATNALSGYLTAASGRELIFSFFANDVPDGGNAVPAMDAALLAIAAAN